MEGTSGKENRLIWGKVEKVSSCMLRIKFPLPTRIALAFDDFIMVIVIKRYKIMGKSCIVKSCPSGRKLKITKNDPSQHLSFFQPSTPARLDKWQKCLGIKLKATNNICHLHFKE
ncbi:Protein of unknown function [Cotesia congregata]|uniref:THAP-type domain-containing protein n=1 Tax=Cotesia congregata TaxID=51543 RepID=A0A8J2HI37_COTCN|nr:Protein of unknown function [Cotesia congregata]